MHNLTRVELGVWGVLTLAMACTSEDAPTCRFAGEPTVNDAGETAYLGLDATASVGPAEITWVELNYRNVLTGVWSRSRFLPSGAVEVEDVMGKIEFSLLPYELESLHRVIAEPSFMAFREFPRARFIALSPSTRSTVRYSGSRGSAAKRGWCA